jgi:hypothetical protein
MKLSVPFIVTTGLVPTTSNFTFPVTVNFKVVVVVIMTLFSIFTNVIFVALISSAEIRK